MASTGAMAGMYKSETTAKDYVAALWHHIAAFFETVPDMGEDRRYSRIFVPGCGRLGNAAPCGAGVFIDNRGRLR